MTKTNSIFITKNKLKTFFLTPISGNIFLPTRCYSFSILTKVTQSCSVATPGGFNLLSALKKEIILADCFPNSFIMFCILVFTYIWILYISYYQKIILHFVCSMHCFSPCKFWRTNCYISQIKFSVKCRNVKLWRWWERQIYGPIPFSYGFIYIC